VTYVVDVFRIIIGKRPFGGTVAEQGKTRCPIVITTRNTWVIAGFDTTINLNTNFKPISNFGIDIRLNIGTSEGEFTA